MKIYIILSMFCSVILLNSCATILSGKKQEVSISIPTKNTKLIIDSVYIAEGTTFKPKIAKDLQFKQLKFEQEGYKTNYGVMVPDYRSKWSYLSWVPFGILLAPLFDLGPNTWVYDDSYQAKPLRKYVYSDSTKKRLFVDNVGVEVNNNNNKLEIYKYEDYVDKSEPTKSVKMDSIGFRNSNLTNGVYEVLKKLNYIDTMNTVIVDNVNTLHLNAKITKITTNAVKYSFPLFWSATNFGFGTFYESEITTQWTLENRFGDTLHKSTINSISGQYNVINGNLSVAQQKALDDAIESSMLDYIDTVTKNNLLKVEPVSVVFNEQIKISKTSKNPTNIEEGMKASVTIKRKEGGHGSGFFISNDGYIVTNYHVISNSSELTIIMNDGTEKKAKVIRSNKATDLALLKIDGNYDYAYNIPEKQNYNVGDEVVTIGTPKSLQLGQSVSKGIVSGTRKYSGMTYVQTDISVNGGNSGGPILLKNGDLISIVKYRIVDRGVEGLSFSIPAFELMQNLGLSY